MSIDNIDVDMAKACLALQSNIVALIEINKLKSRLHKEKYDACIKAGFDKEQALILCQQVF